jgi:riboflavin-specific deaminase-like protein
MPTPEPNSGAQRHIEPIWNALLEAARLVRREETPDAGSAFGVNASGNLYPVPTADRRALLIWEGPIGWIRSTNAPPMTRALLDLYLPICSVSPKSPLTVGHLGQGLDGYIATSSGDSNYVTGPENLLHLHRMRALCDAVLIGAETAATDNPRLTARRADGDNPLRVILDPQRRLAPTLRVFSDHEAPTLLVCDAARVSKTSARIGGADVLGIPSHEGRLDLAGLLEALRARGFVSIFIEGGGRTVSGFLDAGLLDRMQVAIAPIVMGTGRPGIRVLARQRMEACLRPSHRIFIMGRDILFDCDLRGETETVIAEDPDAGGLRRIY